MAIHANTRPTTTAQTLFAKKYEKIKYRDQKCGRALRSRKKLLSLLYDKTQMYPGDQDVERLLAYSSKFHKRFCFFEAGSGESNKILAQLTTSLMLSESFDANIVKISISDEA